MSAEAVTVIWEKPIPNDPSPFPGDVPEHGFRLIGIRIPKGLAVSESMRANMRKMYGRGPADWLIDLGELRAKMRSGE